MLWKKLVLILLLIVFIICIVRAFSHTTVFICCDECYRRYNERTT